MRIIIDFIGDLRAYYSMFFIILFVRCVIEINVNADSVLQNGNLSRLSVNIANSSYKMF